MLNPDGTPQTVTRGLSEGDFQRMAHVQATIDQAVANGQRTVDIYGNGENVTDPARLAQTNALVAAKVAEQDNVPRERVAIMMGGISGSGKSTLIAKQADTLGVTLGPDGKTPSNFAITNPDDWKGYLSQAGLNPSVGDLKPNEYASLTHDESGQLEDAYRAKLLAQGTNIIIDGTMAKGQSIANKMDELRAAGYTIRGAFVDVSPQWSATSVAKRFSTGNQTADGGRYIPPSIIAGQTAENGWTKNLANFQSYQTPSAANGSRAFDSYIQYNNENYNTQEKARSAGYVPGYAGMNPTKP